MILVYILWDGHSVPYTLWYFHTKMCSKPNDVNSGVTPDPMGWGECARGHPGQGGTCTKGNLTKRGKDKEKKKWKEKRRERRKRKNHENIIELLLIPYRSQ
jgi:hypothetical protein